MAIIGLRLKCAHPPGVACPAAARSSVALEPTARGYHFPGIDASMNYSFLPQLPLEFNQQVLFGLLVAIGVIGGVLANRLRWLPSITGFMLAGLIIGPNGLGWLSTQGLSTAGPFVQVALGLILYRLGLELDLRLLRQSPFILIAGFVESMLTFAGVSAVMIWMGLSHTASMLIGAIAISSSPAVLLHVAHELRAAGPVCDVSKSLVAFNNVIAFVVFSLVLPSAFSGLNESADARFTDVILLPLYGLLGSALLGALAGVALHYAVVFTHKEDEYRFALIIAVVLALLGVAEALKLSALFAPLILGVVVTSLEKDHPVSNLQFGEAFNLFFIILFVYAGANLHLDDLVAVAPIALALVAVRCIAKVAGVTAIGALFHVPARRTLSSGLLLIPMAGLAIGLVQTTDQLFAQHLTTVSAVILAAVAVFETLGPPIAQFALRYSGEAGALDDEHESPKAAPARPTQATTPGGESAVKLGAAPPAGDSPG